MSKLSNKSTTTKPTKSKAQLRRLAKRAAGRAAESDFKTAAELQARLDKEAARLTEQMDADLAFVRELLAREEREQAQKLEADRLLALRLQGGMGADDQKWRQEAADRARSQIGGDEKLARELEGKLAGQPAYVDEEALAASLGSGAKIEHKLECSGGRAREAEAARRAEQEAADAELARQLAGGLTETDFDLGKFLEAEEQARRLQAEEDERYARSLAPPAPEPLDEDKMGVRRCPRCAIPLSVLQDVNCGIFMCGATRAGQLDPHNGEAAAAAAKAGELVAGCGRQFQLQGDRLVACVGR